MNAIDFIAARHPYWGSQTPYKLAKHLGWFRERGLLAESGDLCGICTTRFFNRLEDWLIPEAFDPSGSFCFVDLLVADSPFAILDCFTQLVRCWGPRPIVLWERGLRTENGKAPRMFRWNDFEKLTRRLIDGSRRR